MARALELRHESWASHPTIFPPQGPSGRCPAARNQPSANDNDAHLLCWLCVFSTSLSSPHLVSSSVHFAQTHTHASLHASLLSHIADFHTPLVQFTDSSSSSVLGLLSILFSPSSSIQSSSSNSRPLIYDSRLLEANAVLPGVSHPLSLLLYIRQSQAQTSHIRHGALGLHHHILSPDARAICLARCGHQHLDHHYAGNCRCFDRCLRCLHQHSDTLSSRCSLVSIFYVAQILTWSKH